MLAGVPGENGTIAEAYLAELIGLNELDRQIVVISGDRVVDHYSVLNVCNSHVDNIVYMLPAEGTMREVIRTIMLLKCRQFLKQQVKLPWKENMTSNDLHPWKLERLERHQSRKCLRS